jgi:nicotinate-nucleotide adenylyltransferase
VLADPGLAPGRVTLLEIPALAISSSDIRARVSQGDPIRYLVTPGVEAYIAKVGLYAE